MISKFNGLDVFYEIYGSLYSSNRLETFLTLYNSSVDEGLKIPYKDIKNSTSVGHIFHSRVNDLLNIKPFKFTKCVIFCLISNAIIRAFLDGKELPVFAREPKMRVAKLIKTAFSNAKFDMQFMFSEYVFDKISKRHPDKVVDMKDGLILLKDGEKSILGVMAFFKLVDSDYENNLLAEINFAQQKSREFIGIDLYMVFPRNMSFTRYIDIKQNGARLRLVPYKICNKIYDKGY
ncbi:hypothetical protein CFT12S00416_04905 [Campylobacter fetus subsp. testudinum]|uniref:hypothetical protein n=1 Tax=Campylobacter fetus TaxID=196 RepID=UPI0008188DE9|nr:hypothetical protein [Campylobacter fetus]AVK80391.1 hypothetical protein C6B32_00580 [Campylobacter fetus subsp. testudinum]OCR89135.1 hypothetical protein CFT12S00416_04905 [Campylobacter fetus subsp. testudinum]OCS00091.1 hypothetical protein A9K75_04775 [Campylobacter fetus subsp. testudinum]